MYVALRANVRTAAKAREGLNPALRVAFSSGAVMGMTVVGISLVVITVLYLLFQHYQPLTGFAFGASSIALFARVGGGIYTKAADVGADLVGKVEFGIPEDDPRNPATIADNVGDNVGDCAGMAADLFETYAVTMVATMGLGALVFATAELKLASMLYPLTIGGACVVTSIIGTFFVKLGANNSIMGALYKGFIATAVLSLVVLYRVTSVIWGSMLEPLGPLGLT